MSEAVSNVNLNEGFVVIDFWAPWCGPCRKLKPQVAEIEKERTDISFVYSNIDETPQLAEQYKVKSVPCVVFLKDGEEQSRVSGTVTKNSILDMLS